MLETVSAICERLDGLPLAIELAAARTRHLSPANLLRQLEHCLDPLVGGARDLPARHQTMRAALDWSYDLLDEPQSRLFRALSVFRGGVGLDAAAEVAGVGLERALALVSALVDASLVVLEHDRADLPRYRLLDVIREYAAERAQAAAELEALSERHARHFLALAEALGPALRGDEQQRAQERLLLEEGNLREALTSALRGGSSQVALRLAGALWMFWRRAGMFAEGRRWLDAALAAGEDCPPETRLQALWGAGWLAFQQGDYARTEAAGRRMLQLVEESRGVLADGGSIERRNGLTLVGMAAVGEDRGGDALEALGEALELCRGMGTTWHRATSLLNYGGALMHSGRVSEGAELLEEALAIYEELGDREFLARASIQLGYAALLGCDRKAAEARIRRGMEVFAQIGDAWGIAEGLEAVATLLGAADDSDEDSDAVSAAVLVGAAERLRERISARPHPADARLTARQLERARRRLSPGRWDEARRDGYSRPLPGVLQIALK
jgi:tetratricopeptide (TPR) repeat protein